MGLPGQRQAAAAPQDPRGCDGHPPQAEGQGTDQPRRVAGEAGRQLSPLPPQDREAKSGERPRRPQSPPLGPDPSPDLRPSPARDPGRREQEEAGDTCLQLPGLTQP